MEDKTQSEPATKGDLINGLTSLKTELKGDISALAGTVAHVAIELSKTQEDVRQIKAVMATKDDLAAVDLKLSIAVAKTQADIREVKEVLATKMATKDDVSRIMNAIDAFAAEAVAYRNHDVLRGGKIMEHESKLNNHEDRLAVLEKPK